MLAIGRSGVRSIDQAWNRSLWTDRAWCCTDATFEVDHCSWVYPISQDVQRSMENCCASTCTDYTACNLIGEYEQSQCRCAFSPIIIDLDGDGYRLTSTEDGVDF
jgi:hypothetical protein